MASTSRQNIPFAPSRGLVAWLLAATLAFAATLLLATLPAVANDDLADFAFEQNLGGSVPTDGTFTTSDGSTLRFGDVTGNRPTVLALGYFHCPALCSVVRDDVFSALEKTGLVAGRDYTLAVVSIDPSETPQDAARAKADDIDRHPIPGAAGGWHYLVGQGDAVASVAAAVGFKSRYDAHLKQFLHPAGIVVLAPDGRVSGYVLGVGYNPGDVSAAIATASAGGIAKAAVPLLLLCFHYDEATGRYSLSIMKILRIAAALTVLVIGGTLLLAFRRRPQA